MREARRRPSNDRKGSCENKLVQAKRRERGALINEMGVTWRVEPRFAPFHLHFRTYRHSSRRTTTSLLPSSPFFVISFFFFISLPDRHAAAFYELSGLWCTKPRVLLSPFKKIEEPFILFHRQCRFLTGSDIICALRHSLLFENRNEVTAEIRHFRCKHFYFDRK